MATRKQTDANSEQSNTKTSGKQQKTAADFDKTAQEAEKETAPRTGKPGSTGGDASKRHNNGRGGGK